MTLLDIYEARDILENIFSGDLPMDSAFRVSVFIADITPFIEDANRVEHEVIEKHGAEKYRQLNGAVVIPVDSPEYVAAVSEIRARLQVEIDFRGKMNLSDIKSAQCAPRDFKRISHFIHYT